MSRIELSNSQRRMVTALVNKYQQTDSPVKAKDIASVINHNPGTVRNQMQSLKRLNLITGVSGPKGGYKPTENAFLALQREDLDERLTVTLSQDFESLDVTVDEISFPNVIHPDECTAHIHFQQSVPQIAVGDPIAIGPTPLSHLVVAGEVQMINDTADNVLIDVAVMEAPLSGE